MRKAIGSKALNSTAFMVHANEQIFSDRFDVSAQGRELRAALPIAAKQNDAASQRIFKAFFVIRRKGKAFNVNEERRLDVHSVLSTTQ
jgi:hypothetical protein